MAQAQKEAGRASSAGRHAADASLVARLEPSRPAVTTAETTVTVLEAVPGLPAGVEDEVAAKPVPGLAAVPVPSLPFLVPLGGA